MPFQLLFFAALSGLTVFIGGLLAYQFDHHLKQSLFKEQCVHTLMSFGAGIILSAVALVLVPKGLEQLTVLGMATSFMVGAVLFMIIDRYLASMGGQMATLLAMLMDFVPEAIALGAVFAIEPDMALLLALFIGLQNLPESFNSFRDLVHNGFSVKNTLIIFFALSFLGVIGALIGHLFLTDYPGLTAHLMVFASGGILYLLIQDIIPESALINNHYTSLGATLGFLLGVVGEMLI